MKRLVQRHAVALIVTAALVMLAAFPRLIDALKAQAQEPPALTGGTLLVARPGRVDGTFDETVILLLEAGGERTWGVVLNRVRTPEDGPLPDGADRWGGPVRPEHRITLLRSDTPPEGAHRVLDGLSWHEGVSAGGRTRGASLTFAGVAAWAPGQLEEELAGGAWWLMEGHAGAVFTAPGTLWAEHAARHL